MDMPILEELLATWRPRLSEEQRDALGTILTRDELQSSAKDMASNRAPGPDRAGWSSFSSTGKGWGGLI
jgi:hypothetical protein